MASSHKVLHGSKQWIESPAKVFARLKAKVQRETRRANVRETYGADLNSPKKTSESIWVKDGRTENQRFGSHHGELQAVTLSPIASPRTRPGPFTPIHGSALESTAVSVTTEHDPQPAPIRDLAGCKTNRTPTKPQPAPNHRVRKTFEVESAVEKLHMSPSGTYSPMRNRLRKRDAAQDSKVRSKTRMEAQQWKRSHVSDDNGGTETDTTELGGVRGPGPLKRCLVMVNRTLMSPAKMFAYMKERERKREQQEVHQVTNHSCCELPQLALKRCKLETAERQSEDEDVSPGVQAQPVLLEDPLLLNSPSISIPRKHRDVVKPLHDPPPNESVIYLKHWFLRKGHMGLFVDGIHREENIPWNSNIIIKRVSRSAVETVSGRVYFLVGKMKMGFASGFPRWFLNKFINGFPSNWKELYEAFLSESREKDTEKTSVGRNGNAKKNPKAASFSVSLQQNPRKTPASCPPVSSIQVSRSGRVIKPPLEYWKGGRVVLDGDMNVTIHECYDTTICLSDVTTIGSARKSQKHPRVLMPCTEDRPNGHMQCEPASASAPLRKVKASCRKRNPANTESEESVPEAAVQTLIPVERPGSTIPRQRGERMLHLDMVLRKQRESERASTLRSTNRRRDANGDVTATSEALTSADKTFQQPSSDEEYVIKTPSRRVLHKLPQNRTPPSTEASVKTRQRRTRVTKTGNAAQTQKRCSKRSPPANTTTLPKPAASGRKGKANKGRVVVPQEQDEDEWTEAELVMLHEAVSYYPKHVRGYWTKVAKMVGTRSAAECYHQHAFPGAAQTPAKKNRKPHKAKAEVPENPAAGRPVISASVGTFKRKQQVRQFLQSLPREDVDDAFSSAYMQNKCFEMPSMCPSDDHDFAMSDLEPLTPTSKLIPDAKTPQCLHISPGMMAPPNRYNEDKYVFQLQKRMKKNQFNVCKRAQPSKSITPTFKRTMRRCADMENDNFVVWEMLPGNEDALSESEEDFYFSEND